MAILLDHNLLRNCEGEAAFGNTHISHMHVPSTMLILYTVTNKNKGKLREF